MEKTKIKVVKISGEYITLGQFLKFQNIILSGGEAKTFILDHLILVNHILTKQRGKKLKPKDQINIDNQLFFEIENAD